MNDGVLRVQGCREFHELARRDELIRRSRSAFSAPRSTTPWLPRVVLSKDQISRDTLVVIFLRGGMDSLTTVPPYGDPNLYSATLRPLLAITLLATPLIAASPPPPATWWAPRPAPSTLYLVPCRTTVGPLSLMPCFPAARPSTLATTLHAQLPTSGVSSDRRVQSVILGRLNSISQTPRPLCWWTSVSRRPRSIRQLGPRMLS